MKKALSELNRLLTEVHPLVLTLAVDSIKVDPNGKIKDFTGKGYILQNFSDSMSILQAQSGK